MMMMLMMTNSWYTRIQRVVYERTQTQSTQA